MDSTFFTRNNRGESVISAKAPAMKVKVARARPIMVRYWKCQPYESLLLVVSVYRRRSTIERKEQCAQLV